MCDLNCTEPVWAENAILIGILGRGQGENSGRHSNIDDWRQLERIF